MIKNIEELFRDKTIKAKGKVKTLGEWLLNGELPLDELLVYAEKQKVADKATCIEAMEFATKKTPTLADDNAFSYVIKALKSDEPRVKWESSKVIGNTAKIFPNQLSQAIQNLLLNTENTGTVVRWATAYALAEILKLKTENNKELLPKIEALCENEQDNGVKKKYIDAIRKVKK